MHSSKAEVLGNVQRKLEATAGLFFLCVGTLSSGCAVPKVLQEPFEQGVYEDILERQAQGVPMEDSKLKDLPAMSAADYERLGDTYFSRGQLPIARVKYQKALELDPRSWRLEYKLGTLLLRLGIPADALPFYQSIVARDPSNSHGYEGEGRALVALGDHEAGERALRESVRLDSGNWKAQQALGMLYEQTGRLDEAIAAYRTALKTRPAEASVLNNLGVAYYLRKDYSLAIETLERALRTARPDDKKRVYNNLGRCFARSGSYSRAIDSFRRGSDAPTAYNNLGVILLEQDRPRDAAGCFQKAAQTAPSYYSAAQENLVVAMDRSGGSVGTAICH